MSELSVVSKIQFLIRCLTVLVECLTVAKVSFKENQFTLRPHLLHLRQLFRACKINSYLLEQGNNKIRKTAWQAQI